MFWSLPWAVFVLCCAWLKIRKWICLLPNRKLTKLISSDFSKNHKQGKNKHRLLELLPFWQRDFMNDTGKASWKRNLKPKLKFCEWGELNRSHLWCHYQWTNGLWICSLKRGSISPLNHNLDPLHAAACFWSKFQSWTRSWINKLLPVHVCLLGKKTTHTDYLAAWYFIISQRVLREEQLKQTLLENQYLHLWEMQR